MSTTENVLTELGTEPPVYREMGNQLGILVNGRSRPRIIGPSLRGYFLGLHDRLWSAHKARHSGATTYYVRIVPICDFMTDPSADPLAGTPTTENTTKGVTFSFDPFPDGYACTGYEVWAGTVSGTLYKQGELTGRFNTTFVVNSTWTYVSSGSSLSAQVIGPPQFVNCMEVYQTEGAADSKLFLGGGIKYQEGYAKVASSTSAAILTGGTAAESTSATWAAISGGTFRMRLGWSEGSIDYEEWFDFLVDFSGDASMADVAASIQTEVRAAKAPKLFGGTDVDVGITTWQAVTDGATDIYVDAAVVNIVGCDFSGDANMTDVAATIQAAWRTASGGSTETVSWDATAVRLVFAANIAAPTAASLLGYLETPAAGTGTDISSMCAGRESTFTAVLNRRGKAASTETVAWSSDHFVITNASSGDQYSLSFLEASKKEDGTDISSSTYADARVTSNLCTYQPGRTAKRTVEGVGVEWGGWVAGMKFRVGGESKEYLVTDYRDGEDHLLLDSDYQGAGLFGYASYKLLPFDQLFYQSALGNPFKFSVTDQIELPTAFSDGIKALWRMGRNIVAFMRKNIWIFDGVNITAPRLLSSRYGTVNSHTVISHGNGLLFFTGEEIMELAGGRVIPRDPENRVKDLLSRISEQVQYPHARLLHTQQSELAYFFVGIDSSRKTNVAIVFEPESGNYTLHHYKDANASAIVRDASGKEYLITGSTYDEANSAPAFTFLHGNEYYNDGATVDSTKDIQGTIASVGTQTATAGFLTCGTAGNAIGAWQALTEAYMAVTVDKVDHNVGPMDFSGDADFDAVAATVQVAVRAATGGSETCVWDTDHFILTSGTTTNISDFDYLRPYYPSSDASNISGKDFMNGEEGFSARTLSVNKVVLNVLDMDGNALTLNETADKEKGIWVAICDTNGESLQYALVVDNDTTSITVTPDFSTTPSAGWFFFLGAIVPSYTKWIDAGSPQHKHHIDSVAMTVKPDQGTEGNRMFLHSMRELNTTVMASDYQPLGSNQDAVNMFRPKDKPVTQYGMKLFRPGCKHDLKVEDIVVTHHPIR